MIDGLVNDDGEPVIMLAVGGRDWPAVIDTGFNGGLQLPEDCRGTIPIADAGRESWVLANNQRVDEDSYFVQLPFDGEVVNALVSFVVDSAILIGTDFLRDHRLIIDFVARTVRLERVRPSENAS
jgi:predicted aspartyl protease